VPNINENHNGANQNGAKDAQGRDLAGAMQDLNMEGMNVNMPMWLYIRACMWLCVWCVDARLEYRG
jgi:hypothetical protein